MEKFKVGDTAMWDSQAAGYWTRKTGAVVAVVPPKQKPDFGALMRRHGARSNYGGGSTRDHESYVMLVAGGKTDKAKPVLYWPNARQLRKAT